jgi:diaminopimelate decarboxylase
MALDIVDAVAAACKSEGIPVPRLAFEPGRAIVGRSGVTLYTVGTVKDVRLTDGQIRKYVSVDGGMSDNLRAALYQAEYSTRLVSRVSTGKPALVRVVGKHCESGDIVVRHDYLPGDVSNGDIIAVAATGAYCFSLGSNYNYLQRPPVVAVASGKARLIVRGETEADLLSRDACLQKD